MIKIAEISCGTEYAGIQIDLEKAAEMISAELVIPAVDLEDIESSDELMGFKIDSPNLKLATLRARSIIEHPESVDGILIVTCFNCTEGTLVRHAIRNYLQRNTNLPIIMYCFTEKPKIGQILTRFQALVTIIEKKSLLGREVQEGLTVGIDSGSSMTKCVIMEENQIIGKGWVPTADLQGSTEKAMAIAFKDANLPIYSDKVDAYGVTGYGRFVVGELVKARLVQEEITVNAKGAVYLANHQKGDATVIDIGGLDNKVITVRDGIPDNFTMGALCAGASGRFLEIAARRVGVSIEEFGKLALTGNPDPIKLDSYCSIFGIQDLVSELSHGKSAKDVAAAACYSVAEQILEQQLQEIEIREPIIQIGGTALIQGLVKYIGDILNRKILVPNHPHFAGAVGAALLVSGLIE